MSRHNEPCFRPTLRERKARQIGPDLEPRRLNGLDGQASGEGVLDFLRRHPAWTMRSWLLIGEAHQEKATDQEYDT